MHPRRRQQRLQRGLVLLPSRGHGMRDDVPAELRHGRDVLPVRLRDHRMPFAPGVHAGGGSGYRVQQLL